MTSSPTETANALVSFSNALADAVEKAGAATVAVNARHRVASSGIHWRAGVVITADHTVERDEDITVTLADGRTAPAKLAGRDPSTDIAVLTVQGVEAPVATIGDTASLKVGSTVLALGRPGEGGISASFGVVSALSGAWRTHRGGQLDHFVRPDLTFYPGFSGGPLVDAQGQVVGVNTSGLTRGLGVSIPTSTVNRVVEQLLSNGRVARGYMGAGFQPVRLPDALANTLELPSKDGVLIVTIESNAPAEQAGLLIGDVLLSLDGTAISDVEKLQTLLGPDSVGKTMTARLVRGGAAATVSVTVGERPA